MLTTIALTLLAFHPQPLVFDNLSLERSRTLNVKRVLVALLVTKPPYAFKGLTVVGSDDRADGMERTAVLAGRRLSVEGKRVAVAGRGG
jgi:hypothetical protein